MSQEIRQIRLGLKKSSRSTDDGEATFEAESGKAKPLYRYEDWEGTVKGKTKHTYKNGD